MQRKFTSGSRQAPDPYDQFLEENNFFRKHTARDSSCLFRVISEQMYDTQLHHMEIRKNCVQYMAKHRKLFKILIEKDLDGYLDDLSKPKTYGTLVELQAIGYMFKRNIILFEPFNLGNYLNKRNHYEGVFRVFYTPERHFDSVFTADYIEDAAICQSICYEILYTEIYKLPDVGFAVEQMLHSNSLEDGVVRTEFNKEGYCKRIFLSSGRIFDMDLPHNTNCILENYEWCHFHCINFPRISSELNQALVYYKNGNKYINDANYILSLNRTADGLLHNKYISCVRQLLKEGITPFPYKVAKALDPNMYRNIEFDAWNEARKENKYSNWYHGDNNFKVGAKCYVRLHKSDEEFYTCHVQDISIEKGFCLVFIERLGEKRLVPYDALSPLPQDQFKPWDLPYTWQRSSINRHNKNINKFERNLYCSMRYPNTVERSNCMRSNDNILNKSLYNMNSPYYGNEKRGAVNNLHHLLHLNNFPAQSVHYCTMPLSITHAVQEGNNTMQDNNATIQTHNQINTLAANNEFSTNTQQANNPNVDSEVNKGHLDQNGEQIEGNEEGAYGGIGGYYIPHYTAYYGDDNVYYGNNSSQTVTTGYINGGMMYFMNNLPPQSQAYSSNVYMPSPIMNANAAVMSFNDAPTSYCPSTPNVTHCYENNNIVRMEGIGGKENPLPISLSDLNSTITPIPMSINFEARPSLSPQGDDLPVDMVTLRYFYNLGIDYHRKLVLSKDRENNSSEVQNAKTPVSQIADNLRNMVLDENSNEQADSNNNENTAHNANLESVSTANVNKSNNHTNDISNQYDNNDRDNVNNMADPSSSYSTSNAKVAITNKHESYNTSLNHINRIGYTVNRRLNTRQYDRDRYNSRNQNSDSKGGNAEVFQSTEQYNRGSSASKQNYKNNNHTAFKKRNSTTHYNYHNSSFVYGSFNPHVNTHNFSTPPALSINTTSIVEPTYTESNITTKSTTPDSGCAIQVQNKYLPISKNITQNYCGGYNEFGAGNGTAGVYLQPPMPQQPYCLYAVQPPALNQTTIMPATTGAYVSPQMHTHQAGFCYGNGGYWREDIEPACHDAASNNNSGVVMPCYSYPPSVPVFYTPPLPPNNTLQSTSTSSSQQIKRLDECYSWPRNGPSALESVGEILNTDKQLQNPTSPTKQKDNKSAAVTEIWDEEITFLTEERDLSEECEKK